MAETAGKRFNINEKFSTNRRVGKTDFRTDCAKRALNIVGIDKQNTGLIHEMDLTSYRPNVLTSSKFGTYTDAGLDAAKRQYAQNPCPIRLSAGGGGAKSAPHNTLRRTKSALTHRTTAKAQLPPTGHPELVSESPTKFNTS